MSAEGNDTAPLHGARIRKIPLVVKDYNQIKFASDVIVWSDKIVTVMIETDKVLAFWYFFIRSYARYSQASQLIYTVSF